MIFHEFTHSWSSSQPNSGPFPFTLKRYLVQKSVAVLSPGSRQSPPSVSIYLPFLNISYKWSHPGRGHFCLSSFIYHNWSLMAVLLSSLYRWENWGLERLRDSPHAHRLVNKKGTKIWARVGKLFLPAKCLPPPTPSYVSFLGVITSSGSPDGLSWMHSTCWSQISLSSIDSCPYPCSPSKGTILNDFLLPAIGCYLHVVPWLTKGKKSEEITELHPAKSSVWINPCWSSYTFEPPVGKYLPLIEMSSVCSWLYDQ